MFLLFNQYSKYIKIGLAIGLVILLVCSFRVFKKNQQAIGYKKAVDEYTKQALVLSEAARKKELELNMKVGEAENEAKKREVKITKLTADIAIATKRLRNTIDDNQLAASTASAASVTQYTRSLGNVFAECAERYTEMAESADRERSDKMMLAEAWPK